MKENLALRLKEKCVQKKITLALAESCTGGRLASQLTEIAGASHYFLGSVVSYSNQMKIKILGVDPETIATKGAVSEEVVLQMSEGIISCTGADIGVAVSGIAGPEGAVCGKPVGTVCIAIQQAHKKGQATTVFFEGDRLQIMEQAVHLILEKLIILIDKIDFS